MSVASRLAAWWSRSGGLPAVTRAVGEMPTGEPVTVEIFVDGLWSDITPLVMVRDDSGHIETTVGQSGEGSAVDPSSCRFQLNNRNGMFSPRNPMSPLYGKIGRNTKMRVSVPKGFVKDYRFQGEISAWPQKWDLTGRDVWVEVEAAGVLRRLNQGVAPLRSTLYRGLTAPGLTNKPVAYWPCEDATDATTIASGLSDGAPMTILGTPSLAAFSGFASSAALPTMGAGAFVGTVPPYVSPNKAFQVRFLLAVPAAGAVNGQRICSLRCTGSGRRLDLIYGTGGTLTLTGYDGDGTVLNTTGTWAFGVDGKLLRVDIEADQIGVTGDSSVTLASVEPGAHTGSAVVQTWGGVLFGQVTTVTMAPDGGLTDTAVGHISVQPDITTVFDLGPQLAAYDGETAGARVQRLEGEENIPFGSLGNLADTATMGPQGRDTVLNLVLECAAADMGILYERWTSFGLGYRTRISLENQSPGLALTYTSHHLADLPIPVDDDQLTRNDWTVSRPSGSSARSTLDTGALSTQDPPMGVGTYADSVTVNVQVDSQLPDQAAWRVHLGTVDEPRYPQISLNLAHASFVSNPQLRADALGLHPGDRITISDVPSWLPPGDISLLVLGRTETINHFQHTIVLNCAPESPYHLAVVDGTYGWADTEGSILAADAGAADTTVLVTTTAGPSWVPSAASLLASPDEFPFDVQTGGEVMTVTAITGTVADDFNRFVSSSWGTALTGETWTATGGSASDYSVQGA